MIRTNWLCLSLTKTRGWEERDPAGDRIGDYSALVEWAVEEKVLSTASAAALRRRVEENAKETAAAVDRVHDFRAAAHGLLAAIGSGIDVTQDSLTALNLWLPRAQAGLELTPSSEGGFLRRWKDGEEDLDRILWMSVRSLADLLLAPELERLKFCDARDCGWLFIDASRNRSRRWCDMADCGNRAKVRRYRQKQGND